MEIIKLPGRGLIERRDVKEDHSSNSPRCAASRSASRTRRHSSSIVHALAPMLDASSMPQNDLRNQGHGCNSRRRRLAIRNSNRAGRFQPATSAAVGAVRSPREVASSTLIALRREPGARMKN
jgi:hypothetical protein